jgi:antitoxin component YwqK of YwqJK toxin-antitoxin module
MAAGWAISKAASPTWDETMSSDPSSSAPLPAVEAASLPDGPVEMRDPDSGALQETFTRLDGVIHGRYTRFVAGQVAQIASFTKGVLHGEQTFFRDGVMISRMPMVNGLLQGEALFFDGGVLLMSLSYAKGLKHGPCTVFAKGNPSAHMVYEKDKLSGPLIALDSQTGQPLAEVPMHDGQPQGQAQYWTADGYLTRHETFDQGKLAGQAIDYAPNGHILGRRFYRENRLDGPSVRYHPDGPPSEVRTYAAGALVGVETYSEKGTLLTRHGVASGWEDPNKGKSAPSATGPWWKKML